MNIMQWREKEKERENCQANLIEKNCLSHPNKMKKRNGEMWGRKKKGRKIVPICSLELTTRFCNLKSIIFTTKWVKLTHENHFVQFFCCCCSLSKGKWWGISLSNVQIELIAIESFYTCGKYFFVFNWLTRPLDYT